METATKLLCTIMPTVSYITVTCKLGSQYGRKWPRYLLLRGFCMKVAKTIFTINSWQVQSDAFNAVSSMHGYKLSLSLCLTSASNAPRICVIL